MYMLSGCPWVPGGEIHRRVRQKLLGAVLWSPHGCLMHSCISICIPGWGRRGKHMHKSHNFMRVDVSLPPGIMRDRALAERDFVTFPEIFFFSVLSNRCRAMWEVGSLDGFEVLSALSTHSLRPFIWSKCSEKLPTVQRRSNKHIQGKLGQEKWRREQREEGGLTLEGFSTWCPGPNVPGWVWKTTGLRAMLWRTKR